ncbi:hypothetical protein DCO58_00425 [Helicobacter saguini]|uniref:Fibronectin type III domain-containing protein n=1 Tax=Helicobacter saguini TaxID=1548018 RepID=A0A347W180_9HELI|nr:fibronectin type III domain-containing protein [Helicobacter saguini]MWV63142.1 hypothetical protein [Helicobacter saguini]MWV66188.1 hypothetical protein [Helicobacter saguini]MWV71908.1 hypothetical protein [Helicobacter saguini]TLD95922.1 fibronectin type III domain-containing protein [Helicobacter saguini]
MIRYIPPIIMLLITLNFSACSFTKLNFTKDEIDENLPRVSTFRALPDVTSIGFEWKMPENSQNVSGYVIYRKSEKGEWARVAAIPNAFSTHYYDSKLKQQTEYEYAIATMGLDSKVSRKSEPLKVKTSFIDPVSFVYASNNLASQIKIFWSPSPNPVVKNYIIERKGAKGFVAIGSTSNRMLVEYFDNNLESDKEYEYRILSQSYDGAKSVPSQVVKGKTKAPPPQIANIKTSSDKPKYIDVTWDKSEDKDVLGYNVWALDSNVDAVPKGAVGYTKIAFVNGTSYKDNINADGAVRFYKVTAVDRFRLESKMGENGVRGNTLEPPPTPKIVRNVLDNNVLTLQWEKLSSPRVEKYVVVKVGASYGEANRFSVKDTKFVDKELKPGVTYTYYVLSVDKLNIESKPSERIEITIELPKEEKVEDNTENLESQTPPKESNQEPNPTLDSDTIDKQT